MDIKKFISICLSFMLFLIIISTSIMASNDFTLSATPGCKQITLKWTTVESAVNYQPYVYLADGTTYPLIDFPTPDLSYTHAQLNEGQEYCYIVIAYGKDMKAVAKTNKTCAKSKCETQEPENCEIKLKYTVNKKTYYVNDVPTEMDTEPEIVLNRMFLVFRYVTQHVPGTKLDWDPKERKVTLTSAEGKIIKLWIGNPKAEVDGLMVDIDPANPGKGAPFIKNNRTKVPMRFAATHLNALVEWDGKTSTVILTIKDPNCECEWVEGCITDYKEAPNNQLQIFLNNGCDDNSRSIPYLVDKYLKSNTEQIEIGEYLRMLIPAPPPMGKPPRGKLCVDKQNRVKAWEPVEPIPNKCTWTDALVADWKDAPNDQYQLNIVWTCCGKPTNRCCGQKKSYISKSLKSKTDQKSIGDYLKDNDSFDLIPIRICSKDLSANPEETVKEITIQEWDIIPFNRCNWVEGAIVVNSITTNTYSFTFTFYQNCNPSTPIEVNLPINSHDNLQNYTLSIFKDKNKNKDFLCARICITNLSNNWAWNWEAHPELNYPDCCTGSAKKGRIFGKIEGGRCLTTIKIEGISGTTFSGSYQTTSGGLYETSPADMQRCILPCPGNYIVTPVQIPGYDISPANITINVKECCPDKSYEANFVCKAQPKMGKIVGSLGIDGAGASLKVVCPPCPPPGGPKPGIIVIADKNGAFSTECELEVGMKYTVTPSKDGYVFDPPNREVTLKESCPDGNTRTDFKCKKKDQLKITPDVNNTIEAGEEAKIICNFTITNISEKDIDKITLVPICPPLCGKHPPVKNDFSLKIGQSQLVEFNNVTMPANQNGEKEVIFTFSVYVNDEKEQDYSFVVKYITSPPCCTYTLTPSSKSPAQLKPGEAFTGEYSLSNTCPTGSKDTTFTFSPGSNITSVTPNNLTLSPGKTATIKVAGTMPRDCKGGTDVAFIYTIMTDCGKEEKITFVIRCASPPSPCCDWTFRTKPELRIGKWYICPGESSYTEVYEIFNNCPKGSPALNFSFTWPSDGKIVSISPSTFQLPPQGRQSLRIEVKMLSRCKPDEAVVFPFTILTKECGKKEQSVMAYCKDCFCKNQSQIIKVTKIDLKQGWVEGTSSGSRSPIRFYFDPTQTKWASIKLEQCIEICYEERKDRAGNPIKWGLDYRVVACPMGIKTEDILKKLLYLSFKPSKVKKE